MDRVSESLLRKESTAWTPSAFKKPVLGKNPRAVSRLSPPLRVLDPLSVVSVLELVNDGVEVDVMTRPPGSVVEVVEGVPGTVVVVEPEVMPLPKVIFCWFSVL